MTLVQVDLDTHFVVPKECIRVLDYSWAVADSLSASLRSPQRMIAANLRDACQGIGEAIHRQVNEGVLAVTERHDEALRCTRHRLAVPIICDVPR